jgi:urease accessory protein
LGIVAATPCSYSDRVCEGGRIVDDARFKAAPGIEAQAGAPSMVGAARLAFHRVGAQTRLGVLEQRHPLRVLFPDAHDDELPLAVLANVSGGVVGGDRLEVSAAVEQGASAMITSQAAEKIYRSSGATAAIDNTLSVGEGAWLEWLPHETILFDRARLARTMRVTLAPTGRLLAGEIMVFGRARSGERVTTGYLRDAWEIRRGGRLVWCETMLLDGDIGGALGHAMRFGGACAAATLVYSGPEAGAILEDVRGWLGPRADAAATRLDGLVVVRWLSASPKRLRGSYGALRARLRAKIAGLPARLPRIWET